MEEMMNRFKDVICVIIGIIIGVIAPIKASIFALLIGFGLNFLIGWKAGSHEGEKFDIKKAGDSIKLVIFWGFGAGCLYTIINVFEETEFAEVAIEYFTWIVCYWYLVNVLRNARVIFPNSNAVRFLYSIATVEILNVIMTKFGININNKQYNADEYKRDKKL